MATKQQRQTAKRKAKQSVAKEREDMIREAMRRLGGPTSRESAERMSDVALKEVLRHNNRYRSPASMPNMGALSKKRPAPG